MYVILTNECDADCLIRWGHYFAAALDEDLTVLYARYGASPESACDALWENESANGDRDDTQGKIIASMRALRQEHRQEAEACIHIPALALRTLCSPDWHQAVLEELDESRARYVLIAKLAPSGKHSHSATLARRIYERAKCTTILIRTRETRPNFPPHILVPTSGNPDTIDALKIGKRMALCYGGDVTALYITPETGEMGRELGEHILAKVLQKSGLKSDEDVVPRVEPSDDVSRGIRSVAAEGFGLLLAGGPHVGAIRRMLFSTVPDRLFNSREGFTVAVVRSARPMLFRLRETIERWLDLRVPQLRREDRLDLMEALQRNSRWNFDFMALLGLSTCIAALGLIQDSTAVVIGAMLVAPLMTPLLGAGLALVQGNRPLILSCSRSILLGFLMALVIGVGAGMCVPIQGLTSELGARGGPTLLDMGVAFLSGMAAAHCVSRPNLSAALAGVAISAALVPPLATTGISLAMGEAANARGAATLFATNVVSIILGAALTFYAAGIRGRNTQSRGRRWAMRTVMVLMLTSVILAVPLTSVLVTKARHGSERELKVPQALHKELTARVHTIPGAELLSLGGTLNASQSVLNIRLRAARPPTAALAEEMSTLASEHFETPVKVRLHTELLVEAQGAGSPGP